MTDKSNHPEPPGQQIAPAFIEMRGISKRFGGVRALSDVSFSIQAAEIHCLAGENGCGKSTQQDELAEVLRQRGIDVVNTREPAVQRSGSAFVPYCSIPASPGSMYIPT